MKDIASELNISVMTVSKVLRNHSDISEATRERVLKRVRELNFRPSWVARSLVSRRSYVIGLVVPDLMHSFFAEIAKAVSQAIRAKGYTAFISNSEENADIEREEIEFFLARQVDGLIIAPCQPPGRTEIFETIEESGVPFILIDRILPGVRQNYVCVDDEAIGKMATEHLVKRGCRRIAHIQGHEVSTAAGRLNGYRKILLRHGLEVRNDYVVPGGFQDSDGYEAMRRLLLVKPRPDGVFCYNDPVAGGAMNAILETGLSIPGDIAVIGSGNVHYSNLFRVPLSTIDQNSSVLGEKAAELLLELMDSNGEHHPTTILLPPRLILRESA